MLEFDFEMESLAQIKVIGVGGGGSNAVNRMIENGVQGVNLLRLIQTPKRCIWPNRSTSCRLGTS